MLYSFYILTSIVRIERIKMIVFVAYFLIVSGICFAMFKLGAACEEKHLQAIYKKHQQTVEFQTAWLRARSQPELQQIIRRGPVDWIEEESTRG